MGTTLGPVDARESDWAAGPCGRDGDAPVCESGDSCVSWDVLEAAGIRFRRKDVQPATIEQLVHQLDASNTGEVAIAGSGPPQGRVPADFALGLGTRRPDGEEH